jgi:hypothetical protein
VHSRSIAGIIKDSDMVLNRVEKDALKDKPWFGFDQALTLSAALLCWTVLVCQAFALEAGPSC